MRFPFADDGWLSARGPGKGSLVCLIAFIHSHPFRHTDSVRRIRAPAICNSDSSQHQTWEPRCMLEYALALRKLPSWGPVLPHPEISLESQLGGRFLLVHPDCAWGSQWPPLLQGRSFSSTPGLTLTIHMQFSSPMSLPCVLLMPMGASHRLFGCQETRNGCTAMFVLFSGKLPSSGTLWFLSWNVRSCKSV